MQLPNSKNATAEPMERKWLSAGPLRHWLRPALLLGCLSGPVVVGPVYAQENAPTLNASADSASSDRPERTSLALAQRGTVTFRETPLAEVILILSEQWNVNIIAGADVQGQVNGTFKDESLKSILDSILLSNGLQFRPIGNSLVVLPNTEMGSNRSNFRVEVLDTRVTSSEEMEELITALKLQMSADGQLVPMSASGKLTVLDSPERIEAVKALLEQLAPAAADRPNYVSTQAESIMSGPVMGAGDEASLANNSTLAAIELRPQYILASDLQPPLAILVGETNVSVVAQENSIVIFGDATSHRKAQLLMQQLDKPRAQVRITGYIYDVDVSELEKLGVDWSKKLNSVGVDVNGVPNNMTFGGSGLLTPSAITNSANSLSGVVTETAGGAVGGAVGGAAGGAAAAAAAAPVGGQFLFRTLSSGFELQALVQALEQTKGSRLLADPHITVVDRHLATFEAKTRIPIQQLTQTQQGGAIGSTTFVDAGISLTVTPRIANDGTIEMQLTPIFSTLVGFDREGKPIIDERNASTVVRVNHGQALAIGGLRRKNTVESVKGIPGLMNIKYLGALFRTHDTDVRESELLVFIMPEIVGYCGGLPREMAALQVSQQQLSRVATAVDGPFTPDCKDKHCPHHNERPKIHNGMVDNGLIGSHDMIFVDPQAACLFPNCPSPSDTQSPSPTSSSPISIVPTPSRPEPEPEVPTVQFQELPPALPTATPVKTQLPVGVAASKTAASNTAAQRGEPSRFQAQSSSRRVPARSASFKR